MNWKKVVILNTEHDNLILCSFSNSTASSAELFIHMGPLGVNIRFVLIWPFSSRCSVIFLELEALELSTIVMNSIVNTRDLKNNEVVQLSLYKHVWYLNS